MFIQQNGFTDRTNDSGTDNNWKNINQVPFSLKGKKFKSPPKFNIHVTDKKSAEEQYLDKLKS
jgi:hypothetical protein